MGGFPDLAGLAARSARRTPTAAPTSSSSACRSRDPLADGPVIQAAGTRALAAGATVAGVLEVADGARARGCRSCSCATRTSCSRAASSASPTTSRAAGRERPDRARTCRSRRPATCAPPARPPASRSCPLVAPTTPDERLAAIGAAARGFLYTVSVTGTTGERDALSDAFAAVVARAKAHTDGPGRAGLRHRDAGARRRGGGGRGRRRDRRQPPRARGGEAEDPPARCARSWRRWRTALRSGRRRSARGPRAAGARHRPRPTASARFPPW